MVPGQATLRGAGEGATETELGGAAIGPAFIFGVFEAGVCSDGRSDRVQYARFVQLRLRCWGWQPVKRSYFKA